MAKTITNVAFCLACLFFAMSPVIFFGLAMYWRGLLP
jgi:hypothetical protein